MKTFLTYLSSFVLFLFLLSSCQSHDIEDVQLPSEVTANYDQTITFKYKGEIYTSKAAKQGETLVLENKEVQDIFDQIQLNPNLVSYRKTAELVEYYDTLNEFEELNKSEKEPELRAIKDRYTTWGKLTIYENPYRNGRSWAFYLDDTSLRVNVPDLDGYCNGYISLNNKVSSFDLEACYKTFTGTPPASSHGDHCRVYFYTEKNYGGQIYVYDVDPFNDKLFVNLNSTWVLWKTQEDQYSSLIFLFVVS